MDEHGALQVAVQLFHMPVRVRATRRQPLPPGMTELLRVAARDAQTLDDTSGRLQRDADTLVAAARFFVEQILFASGADNARVLGARADADISEMKRHMALLMTWLHPDALAEPMHAAYALRVTAAWNELKTQHRARADAGKDPADTRAQPPSRDRQVMSRAGRSRDKRTVPKPPSLLRQLLLLVLGPRRA
jgi:hypothetical protein